MSECTILQKLQKHHRCHEYDSGGTLVRKSNVELANNAKGSQTRAQSSKRKSETNDSAGKKRPTPKSKPAKKKSKIVTKHTTTTASRPTRPIRAHSRDVKYFDDGDDFDFDFDDADELDEAERKMPSRKTDSTGDDDSTLDRGIATFFLPRKNGTS